LPIAGVKQFRLAVLSGLWLASRTYCWLICSVSAAMVVTLILVNQQCTSEWCNSYAQTAFVRMPVLFWWHKWLKDGTLRW